MRDQELVAAVDEDRGLTRLYGSCRATLDVALVERLELRVGAAEISLRRRDLPMAGKSLRRGEVALRPERDRRVTKPVRGDVFRKAGSLRRVAHDLFRRPHAHA